MTTSFWTMPVLRRLAAAPAGDNIWQRYCQGLAALVRRPQQKFVDYMSRCFELLGLPALLKNSANRARHCKNSIVLQRLARRSAERTCNVTVAEEIGEALKVEVVLTAYHCERRQFSNCILQNRLQAHRAHVPTCDIMPERGSLVLQAA